MGFIASLVSLIKMAEKFNLTWHTFSSHGKDLFRELMETQAFSDVILVSDDQHQFRAHKFMLSSCSSVFQNLLESNPQNMTIYLRGIHHQELQSILQFIYLGEASFYQERMNEFLNVAKDLNIKEIGENVVEDDGSNDDMLMSNSELIEEPSTTNESERNYESVSKVEVPNCLLFRTAYV